MIGSGKWVSTEPYCLRAIPCSFANITMGSLNKSLSPSALYRCLTLIERIQSGRFMAPSNFSLLLANGGRGCSDLLEWC